MPDDLAQVSDEAVERARLEVGGILAAAGASVDISAERDLVVAVASALIESGELVPAADWAKMRSKRDDFRADLDREVKRCVELSIELTELRAERDQLKALAESWFQDRSALLDAVERHRKAMPWTFADHDRDLHETAARIKRGET